MTNEVSNHLKCIISPYNIKIALELGIIKPVHAKLIDELYTRLHKI